MERSLTFVSQQFLTKKVRTISQEAQKRMLKKDKLQVKIIIYLFCVATPHR